MSGEDARPAAGGLRWVFGKARPMAGPVHVGLAYIIAGIVALHVAAALWHQFVRRDNLLARMLPARTH